MGYQRWFDIDDDTGAGVLSLLTVKQPWASLIVSGVKKIENRSWATQYRGPLVIHASARPDRPGMTLHGSQIDSEPTLGAIVGCVILVDCVRDSDDEYALADHWHWVLTDARRLATPIPMKGQLNIWHRSVEEIDSADLETALTFT